MKHTFMLFSMFLSLSCCSSSHEKAPTNDSTTNQPQAVVKNTTDTTQEKINDSPIPLLYTGSFHSDEVWKNADKMAWIGLFFSGKNYYLASSKIKIEKVHDEVVDADNEKTGWEVSTSQKDSCIFLTKPQSFLKASHVTSLGFTQKELIPNDTLSFSYKGINYQLYATGIQTNYPESDEITYKDYRLFIQTEIEGKKLITLLETIESFDGAIPSVLFVGDIDGDGIVDLFLNMTNHYNAFEPTLYLSKPAEKGSLLKKIAWHTSVGC